MANVNTTIKDIVKAAKKAGITMTAGKGSHVKWTAPNGRVFSFAGHGKETSFGVAKKAWAFINGDYDAAY
jgi:predicted RNA binding protein YcfA (HicA-like mRNA interferase family)